MTTSLSSALTLMVIGMITVFMVLYLVYLTGTILIKVINRWFPEPIVADTPANRNPSSNTISSSKIAAITTAVEIFSGGKARIINIEKH